MIITPGPCVCWRLTTRPDPRYMAIIREQGSQCVTHTSRAVCGHCVTKTHTGNPPPRPPHRTQPGGGAIYRNGQGLRVHAAVTHPLAPLYGTAHCTETRVGAGGWITSALHALLDESFHRRVIAVTPGLSQ